MGASGRAGRQAVSAVLLWCAMAAATRGAGASGQDVPAREAPTFTLTGKVVDAVLNTPIVAAVIKVPELKRLAYTDGNGSFRFTEFPQGTWEIVVEQLGYHASDGAVTVSEGNGLFIRLNPDPIALDELRIRTRSDRLLTRRRNTIPYRVVTVRTDAFANAINPDPVVIFRRAANTAIVSCPGDDSDWLTPGCLPSRGGYVRISVYLDEGPMLGGMRSLQTMSHESIHSMDWIPGMAMLRVYTKRFIEKLDNSRIALSPLVW